jgi:hypothetical protein
LSSSGAEILFDLSVADWNLWTAESMPVLLVVFDAQKRQAWWLYVQQYSGEHPARAPRSGAKTVLVYIPRLQRFGRRSVAAMRAWKRDVLEQTWGKITYA